MENRLHDKLLADIEALRSLLHKCSTQTVVGYVASLFLKWPKEDVGLTAPYKQLFFLLGLLLSTPEPSNPEEFGDANWQKSKDLLEHIFLSYVWMYWPALEEKGNLSPEWHSIREVAMPAFLNYFNSGNLASTVQIRERIQQDIVPFDTKVQELFGISASTMLLVAKTIGDKIQADFDNLAVLGDTAKKELNAFLDWANKSDGRPGEIHRRAKNTSYEEATRAFAEARSETFKIKRQYLEKELDEPTVTSFCNIFTAVRGSVSTLNYPTDDNPALRLPLYLLPASEIMVPAVHSIYLAILETVERALLNSDKPEGYLRRRDKKLESETVRVFNDFCGEQATIVESVYETETLQFEHDIVISWNRKVFVIEAKASPPRMPLREPAMAYVRIKDDFRSDRGLQKAYEQANRIEAAFIRGEIVRLYNAARDLVLEISPSNTDRVYSICVTRDNFGSLATNLSLLLIKEPDSRYPWAVCVLDLEAFFETFRYFGWGMKRFCEYLDGREKMHGYVKSDDELVFLGYLIAHGTFDYMFKLPYTELTLEPNYAEVIDRIHLAQRGGQAVEYKPSPPVTMDMSAEIKKIGAEFSQANSPDIESTRNQGRNERCACGSGKKYKKCCGRL